MWSRTRIWFGRTTAGSRQTAYMAARQRIKSETPSSVRRVEATSVAREYAETVAAEQFGVRRRKGLLSQLSQFKLFL